ncbi:KAP family P-loop domain protein [Streptomyces sp. YIM 121038]|uniref:caspase, EACC1-associated type n=1 Tax=Streptomyces sp. YIM 121038 TaxID=2136401 RepID=UPI00116429DC|nr:P-loop NTPase fold protein [Streptomyces sp. YIM 121038]QCX80436.1 KAP family P-loop domain protein [Streptomyces sp. YIM 121038]
MARLPDPGGSQAVLIGCGSYAELTPLPAIDNNLVDLGEVLGESGGFRPEGVAVISDPRYASEVVPELRELSERATDVLLVYYAGHGLVGDDGELYLGLRDTVTREPAITSLPFERLRDVLRRSPARTRVLILDCCFSGRAITTYMGAPSSGFAPLSEVSGTFTLVSSTATALSIARPDEPYTAFTGELIRLLKQGVPGAEELLTLQTIAAELRRTMTAAGYPEPQTRDENGIGALLGLAPNPAYDPTAGSGVPAPTTGESGTAPGGAEADDVEDVEWAPDAPATVDLLRRVPTAKVLALRLVETQLTQPDTSFLVHLDGPWGSGKSSLLNLLGAQVDDHFLVARFDAWQQSRLAPAWWSLLTCLRQRVVRARPWWLRPFVRLRESVARARRTGAPYAVAFALVALTAGVLGYLIWPEKSGLLGWEKQVKAATALLAALGTLGAGALLAARLLLWDSVRGARLFEQTQANPMADVAAHFQWLLRRAKKPVVLFVDDLDRCDQAYVVEFLDMIQTLVRAMGSPRGGRTERAAHVVVAADGTWLRRSYEVAHASFADCVAEPGRPLGHLFLDKLFQLSLPIPALSAPTRTAYLDEMLRVVDARPEEEVPPSRAPARPRVDGDVMERLRRFEEGRAQAVYAAMQRVSERRRAEHTLRKFVPVLGDNPRAVKRFLNTYSVLRPIRFLEGVHVDPDALALWSLICVRWPDVADHLAACPEAVEGIAWPLWAGDHFPEPLRTAAESPELRAVVTSPDGGPLTPELIRQCRGAHRGPAGHRSDRP